MLSNHQITEELLKIKKHTSSFLIDTFLWFYTSIVLWKIFYEKLILNLRYPNFLWSTPLISLIVGIIISSLLYSTSLSFGRLFTGLKKRDENKSILKEPSILFLFFILFITFVTGIFISQVSIYEFFSHSGLKGAQRIFKALLTPNFSIFTPSLFAAIETIYMAFIATAIALPFAFILAFFSARNLMSDSKFTFFIYTIVRFFLNTSRSIEPLVWAIIFSVWVGIGPFSGMLALCLHSISSLSKLYSEQIENISDGPLEAMTATGAHPIQVIWFGVVPQIILPYLSFTIYRWDINVRMATIIGLVGGGGIGTMLMQYQGLSKWNEVGMLVVMIALIVWMMDSMSSHIRNKIK